MTKIRDSAVKPSRDPKRCQKIPARWNTHVHTSVSPSWLIWQSGKHLLQVVAQKASGVIWLWTKSTVNSLKSHPAMGPSNTIICIAIL
jgi:hypothetical protein